MYQSNTLSGNGYNYASSKLLFFALLFFCSSDSLTSQESLYANLSGDVLLDSLVEAYKPSHLLTYGPARDSMYLNVYREADGRVECFYTGHRVFLPIDVDPSSFLYNNESPTGITAEHIYPQSKGAGEGNARSDMHSLVPVIWQANAGRSNYPFGEIPDDETDHWYYRTEDLRSMPTMLVDEYSEKLNGGFGHIGKFEPRESIKGNIARAVFYFYTMYKDEADEEDPEFFQHMKETLFQWHLDDPVDSLEYIQNYKKAVYQESKINPFISDCSLVARAYFERSDMDCTEYQLSYSKSLPQQQPFRIFPNPVQSTLNIDFDYTNNDSLIILDIVGNRMMEIEEQQKEVDVTELPKGLYFVKLVGQPVLAVFAKA